MMLDKSVVRSLLLGMLTLAAGARADGNHHGDHDPGDGIGRPASDQQAGRTITVIMSDDMRYTPSNLRVRRGETIHLRIINRGQVRHELSLGTRKALLEHLEQMRKFPEMEHAEAGKVTVPPGGQARIDWEFTRTGVVEFGCLIPGHYEAGMRGFIKVSSN